ncbi:pyruvate dehydrogenase (acetyl-transferring) kinase, mitochondrial [Tanacetum coccineum]
MLRVFLMSLTGDASRWLRNGIGFNHNWKTLKTTFSNKYCPPARTTKKMEEIKQFAARTDEILFRAWEKCKELLNERSSAYLTDMQEVFLFYNGSMFPTRQILDLKGNTKTYDGLAAIQAQLNNLGREIKKVNKKVYAAQEEGNSLERLSTRILEHSYQPARPYRAAGPGFYQRNNKNSSYPDRRQTLEESLTKFMAESAKRHKENSNIIKEIRASTDAAIRNQGASIKTLEIQIG